MIGSHVGIITGGDERNRGHQERPCRPTPKFTLNWLIDKRPTQVSVGVDEVDRLEEEMEVLDARVQICTKTSCFKAISSAPNIIGLNGTPLSLGGLRNQHPNSQGDAVVAT